MKGKPKRKKDPCAGNSKKRRQKRKSKQHAEKLETVPGMRDLLIWRRQHEVRDDSARRRNKRRQHLLVVVVHQAISMVQYVPTPYPQRLWVRAVLLSSMVVTFLGFENCRSILSRE